MSESGGQTGADAVAPVSCVPGTAQLLRERLLALQGRATSAPERPARTAPPPTRQVAFAHGREIETPLGTSYLIERRFDLDYRHGAHQLGALQAIAPALLASLAADDRLAGLPHERILLLDTETTGLAGGTGTYVFLVGLGSLALSANGAPQFVVRQYFLRHLHEEAAFLHAVGAALHDHDALISFNGKSFDWPLLATRFTLKRMTLHPTGPRLPHLDLLHPARRVWRHRLASCSLTSLESEVLGIQREHDIPGSLIPDLYFRYLRDGNTGPLGAIVAHNAADILSLLGLLIHLAQLLDQLTGETPPQHSPRAADLYGLATLHAALGRTEASATSYRAALADRTLPTALRQSARQALSRALKRQRSWSESVAIWQAAITTEARRKRPDPWAHLELAKYYEHVARDYAAAIQIVEAGLALLALRGTDLERDNLLHRLERLQRKLARHRPISVASQPARNQM